MTEIIGQWKSLAVAHGCWTVMHTRSDCSSAAEVTVLLSGQGTASQQDKPGGSPNPFFSLFFTRPQQSWIWELDQDYWLRMTSERQCHTTHRLHRCSKVICCNFKQIAHFWDDFQDSVLTCRGKKGKALVFFFNNRSTKPRDIWVVIQGEVGMTSGSILYGYTAFLPLSRCLSGNPALEAWPGNTDLWHWKVYKQSDMDKSIPDPPVTHSTSTFRGVTSPAFARYMDNFAWWFLVSS